MERNTRLQWFYANPEPKSPQPIVAGALLRTCSVDIRASFRIRRGPHRNYVRPCRTPRDARVLTRNKLLQAPSIGIADKGSY